MTPEKQPGMRKHFEAIMTAVYEHARLSKEGSPEDCGRQFAVIQGAFADFEESIRAETTRTTDSVAKVEAALARSEALEAAAKIADIIACSEEVASKSHAALEITTRGDMLFFEHVGGSRASRVIASAIRDLMNDKGASALT